MTHPGQEPQLPCPERCQFPWTRCSWAAHRPPWTRYPADAALAWVFQDGALKMLCRSGPRCVFVWRPQGAHFSFLFRAQLERRLLKKQLFLAKLRDQRWQPLVSGTWAARCGSLCSHLVVFISVAMD